MKKFLMVMGAVFLLIVVVCGALFGVAAIKGVQLDKESKVYVESILPPLLADFTTDNFIKYVSPANKPTVNRETMDKFTAQVSSQFGLFKSYEQLRGDSRIDLLPSGGMRVAAVYFGKARFEKGTAEMRVLLLNDGKEWSLARVDFEPENEKKTDPSAPSQTGAQ